LTRQQEHDLIVMWQTHGAKDARDLLIVAHTPELRLLARPFMRSMPEWADDLFAEAVEGFLVGMSKFDPTRPARLTTYARWWVRDRLQTAAIRFEHSTSGRRGAQGRKARRTLRNRGPQAMTTEFERRLGALFDGPYQEGHLFEDLPDPGESPEDQAATAETVERVHRAIERLPADERGVVEALFWGNRDFTSYGAQVKKSPRWVQAKYAAAIETLRWLLGGEL